MLASIVIGPSPDLANEVQLCCASSQNIVVQKTLSEYRTPYQLFRLMNQLMPEIVFLEVGCAGTLQTARDIRAISPQTPIVGYGRGCQPKELREAEEAGAASVLQSPFSEAALQRAVARAIEEQSKALTASIFVFLPAKAGSGASTIALNVASALARHGKRKILLIDADLHSGLLAVLLGQNPDKSVTDALEESERLDEKTWSSLVARGHGLDLLAAPRSRPRDGRLFSPWSYFHLLGFVRARYGSVIVDLPEVVNDATEAVVQQAKTVYLVCTPEIPSLVLARRRIRDLEDRGLEEHRLGIVLTRYMKGDMKIEKVEQMLQRKVVAVIPNDYAALRRASLEARPLKGRSKPAKAFAAFARMLEDGMRGEREQGRGGAFARLIDTLTLSRRESAV